MTADIAGLVLLAAVCAVGPTTAAVHVGGTDLRWQPFGGGPAFEPGPVPDGAAVVGLSVYDDTVGRLEYALRPGGALLAVTPT
ncbi:hypothetical protein AB0H83_19260 [Dactylosporangium sp. NPDC050688]|uniref:hypothetical protein n=1 Tax=Dactylosporangium sp. NPDC050688 TaxID=3157217 RepID=UPI0034073EDD